MHEILIHYIPTHAGHVAMITLNRPKQFNALTQPMCEDLSDFLKTFEKSKDICAVMIKGSGDKAFCAGGDIRFVYENGLERASASLVFFETEYAMNRRLHYFKKPYIAMLDGIAMGGGLGVSLHGSHAVASERLQMAMPETGIGFYPDVGATYFLSRLPHFMGYYLGLTGVTINAHDAYAVGLIQGVISNDQWSDFDSAFQSLDSFEPEKIDDLIDEFSIKTIESELVEHQAVIAECFSKDTVEAIIESLERYNTSWTQKTLERLSRCAPVSLKVTLEALKRGAAKSFDQCMKMEAKLSKALGQRADFYEGIRAAIIDKDHSPRWEPGALSEVSDKDISRYF